MKRVQYNQTANHYLWSSLYDDLEKNDNDVEKTRDRLRILRKKLDGQSTQLFLTSGLPNRVGGLQFEQIKTMQREVTTLKFPKSEKDQYLSKPISILLSWKECYAAHRYMIYGIANSEEFDVLLGQCNDTRCYITDLPLHSIISFYIAANNTTGMGEESCKIYCRIDEHGNVQDPFSSESRKQYNEVKNQQKQIQKRLQRERKKQRKLEKENFLNSLTEIQLKNIEKSKLSHNLYKALRSNRDRSKDIKKLVFSDLQLGEPYIINIASTKSALCPLHELLQNHPFEDLLFFVELVGDKLDWDARDPGL